MYRCLARLDAPPGERSGGSPQLRRADHASHGEEVRTEGGPQARSPQDNHSQAHHREVDGEEGCAQEHDEACNREEDGSQGNEEGVREEGYAEADHEARNQAHHCEAGNRQAGAEDDFTEDGCARRIVPCKEDVCTQDGSSQACCSQDGRAEAHHSQGREVLMYKQYG